jgi:hypothetical protein
MNERIWRIGTELLTDYTDEHGSEQKISLIRSASPPDERGRPWAA